MGVNNFLGERLDNSKNISEQDTMLKAVSDEISNKGFIIGQADKLFNWANFERLISKMLAPTVKLDFFISI